MNGLRWRAVGRRGSVAGGVLWVAAGLLVLGVVVYVWHVAAGGFYIDDWAEVAAGTVRHQGYFGEVGRLTEVLGDKPLLAVFLPVPFEVFGAHPAGELAVALALGVATSVCFYALLVELGMRRRHAAAIAALTLVYPFSDSARLWSTAGVNDIAVIFYALGVIVALRGLRRTGRSGVAMHAAAVGLYVGVFPHSSGRVPA